MPQSPSRAFIAGCAGPVLTDEERVCFADAKPWGLILFRRNVVDPDQLRALTASFRDAVGWDAPVLVDQEGGRVQRLTEPHWPKYPAAARFGHAPGGAQAQADLARLSARLMAADLAAVGIDMDCLPVLDVPAPEGHGVIGDRAYGDDPEAVVRLGGAAARGLLEGGVLPVFKHVPGHGRAAADSHFELPRVSASRAELERVDFVPFRALADLPVAMTAHVVYEAIDHDRPATLSPKIVSDIIRGFIGFDGLLMTDDLSMKALTGSFAERTAAAFGAGVDLVLHCNGDLAEARPVAEASPWLEGRSLERAQAALTLLHGPTRPLDPVDAWARLRSGLEAAA